MTDDEQAWIESVRKRHEELQREVHKVSWLIGVSEVIVVVLLVLAVWLWWST